jgi:hypothetical protein
LPLLERVRIEVYLPDPLISEYENLLQSLTQEFTYAFGGCSIVRGIEGHYGSVVGNRIRDRINLVYVDAPALDRGIRKADGATGAPSALSL